MRLAIGLMIGVLSLGLGMSLALNIWAGAMWLEATHELYNLKRDQQLVFDLLSQEHERLARIEDWHKDMAILVRGGPISYMRQRAKRRLAEWEAQQ